MTVATVLEPTQRAPAKKRRASTVKVVTPRVSLPKSKVAPARSKPIDRPRVWDRPSDPPTGRPVDHLQLPEEDGTFVKNFQEHPQSMMLTDSIKPLLNRLHPDQHYAIGQDCGIYWRWTEPPEKGAEAPDWFYVPGVPATLDGEIRRSYVMWRESVAPLIVIEFVSGNGDEEKDRTPFQGKFWIYETAIRPLYYAIYFANDAGKIELYRLEAGVYVPVTANERNHYPVAPLQVELGLWPGEYLGATLPWLRWWDADGNLLPLSEEALQQANLRAERLAAQLRALGIEPA